MKNRQGVAAFVGWTSHTAENSQRSHQMLAADGNIAGHLSVRSFAGVYIDWAAVHTLVLVLLRREHHTMIDC